MRLVFVVALVIVCSTLIAAQQTLKQNQAVVRAALNSCRCRRSLKCELNEDSSRCNICDKISDSTCQSATIASTCATYCLQRNRKFKDRFDCITKDFKIRAGSNSPISCGVFGYSLDAFNSCLRLSERRPQRQKEALALVAVCNSILNYGPMQTSPPKFDL